MFRLVFLLDVCCSTQLAYYSRVLAVVPEATAKDAIKSDVHECHLKTSKTICQWVMDHGIPIYSIIFTIGFVKIVCFDKF